MSVPVRVVVARLAPTRSGSRGLDSWVRRMGWRGWEWGSAATVEAPAAAVEPGATVEGADDPCHDQCDQAQGHQRGDHEPLRPDAGRTGGAYFLPPLGDKRRPEGSPAGGRVWRRGCRRQVGGQRRQLVEVGGGEGGRHPLAALVV